MTDPRPTSVKYSIHGKSRSMYTLYCHILDSQDCSRSFTVTYKLVVHKPCYCVGNGARQTHGDHYTEVICGVWNYNFSAFNVIYETTVASPQILYFAVAI